MPRSRHIVGVDAARAGASAVVIMDPQPPLNASEPWQTRLIGAPPGQLTLVHEELPDGQPYRVELFDPGPIERDVPPTRLPPRQPSPDLTPEETAEHIAGQAKATQFLVTQICPDTPDRVGIVVPDEQDPVAAERMYQNLRTPRARVEFFPWPVAAAWAWLEHDQRNLPEPPPDRKSIVGTILTIHLMDDGWEAVAIHLLADPDVPHLSAVPARDRDADDLHRGSFASSHGVDGQPTDQDWDELCALCTDLEYDFLGLVVVGRAFSAETAKAAFARISSAVEVESSEILVDTSSRVGLLSCGSAWAALTALNGDAPYYETLPQIEVLGRMWSWGRRFPYGRTRLPYWVDALHGLLETIDGRRLVPSTEKLKYSPNLPNLHIQPGDRIPIEMAFAGEAVRRIFADVPGTVFQNEKVELQVEYQLGSGCPTVTILRAGNRDPIVFRWDIAETISETRDEMTLIDAANVEQEHKRRQQIRKNDGYSV